MNDLTIAILTKMRPRQLERCLDSLVRQTSTNFRLLIVDNDPYKTAQVTCKKFRQQLPITYVSERTPGVPTARNTALKKCQTNYIAFIDDDCVVDPRWVDVATKQLVQINGNNRPAYLLGRSELLNEFFLVAVASHSRDAYWRRKQLRKNSDTISFVDTKNIILDTNVIKKHRLRFDTNMSLGWHDIADTDLGVQLSRLGKTGRYVPDLIVHHEEQSNFFKYLHKAFVRGRLSHRLVVKWQMEKQLIDFALENWLSKSIREKVRERRYWLTFWQKEYRHFLPFFKNQSRLARWFTFFCIKMYDKRFLDGYTLESQRS